MSSAGFSRAFDVIISRAFIDKSFRDRLISDKESVIQEYTLTPEEIDAVHAIDAELLDKARQTAAMVPKGGKYPAA